ncbi:hypothetical protein AB0J82_33390 [Asanoa sp. NPDC049518]|uniref:hypothetical protein n=1 Tax=unclassified Asanoa TaxID=2685164 RepID=UPI003447BE96
MLEGIGDAQQTGAKESAHYARQQRQSGGRLRARSPTITAQKRPIAGDRPTAYPSFGFRKSGITMRRRLLWPALVCCALLSSVAACATGGGDGAARGAAPGTTPADTSVGTGFLDVADLRDPPMTDHFTAPPKALEGRLALHANGCVTVVVDGVERMPLWPEGTDVVQESITPNRYAVTLPAGVRLVVSETSADTFAARGIVDDNPDPFEVEAGLPTKISTFLAFCGVKAEPVAFPDAASFTVRKT